MFAVTGKMLTVDLRGSRIQTEELPEQMYREYLGGYGLGVALLMERMDPATDPLGPDNILGFAAGYLTGTGAYIASRFMCFGKSPSTGGWGDANCGGHFGPALKRSGFDVILFTGQASEPVYLLVDEGKASLQKADVLWGQDCYATEDELKERYGRDCQAACIGPAGEHLSSIAGISNDKGRFAARSGLGAVMGSKKLKALVVKGKLPIEIADPDKLKALRKQYAPELKEGLGQGLSDFGTPWFYGPALEEGDVPVKNWSASKEALKTPASLNDEQIMKYQVKRYACSGCPIGCGGHVQVQEGPFKTGTTVHKVEYESMSLLGPNLLVENPEALIRMNDLCNRYGMDTIGCGGLCAFAFECYEKGLIDSKAANGLDLSWGNAEAAVALVEQIGKAEGIGALLSRGFKAAVESLGPESRQFVMAVHNEGLPAHDPRWNAGLALTYYSDPTPARHTQGSTAFPLAGYDMPNIDAHQAEGRAKYHHDNVNWTHVLNSAGLCLFGYIILDYKSLPEFLEAAGGGTWTLEELAQSGLKITLLRHLFNLKAGVNFLSHTFPARALGNPPLQEGATKGVQVDLETMVREYQETLGLDPQTSRPSEKILKDLGLDRFL